MGFLCKGAWRAGDFKLVQVRAGDFAARFDTGAVFYAVSFRER
jgi:hypothetical protein